MKLINEKAKLCGIKRVVTDHLQCNSHISHEVNRHDTKYDMINIFRYNKYSAAIKQYLNINQVSYNLYYRETCVNEINCNGCCNCNNLI